MWKSIVLVSLGLAAVQVRAEPELKGPPSELTAYLAGVPKIVSIAGESELKVAADRALISLKVVTENKSLQEAAHANQELRGKILRALAERGIPGDRVKSSRFSSTPKYGMFKEKAKSYRVENVVRITAQDEKEFQAVANLVDSFSEVRYESIEFEHSDKDRLKANALAQAVDKADEKKKLFEEKLNVKLSPKRFSESGVVIMPQSPQARYGKALGYASSATPLPAARAAEPEEEEMSTSFSEVVYKAQITIEYAVEGK